MLVGANANIGAPARGNQEGENSSNVYMMKSHVGITKISCDYGEVESSKSKGVPSNSEPLHIERPAFEPIPRMLKGSAKHMMINPNAKAAQNYSIV